MFAHFPSFPYTEGIILNQTRMNKSQVAKVKDKLDQLQLTQQDLAGLEDLLKSFNLRDTQALSLVNYMIEAQDNAENAGIEEGEYRAEDAYTEGFKEFQRRAVAFAHRQVRAINYLSKNKKRAMPVKRLAADFLKFVQEETV